MDILSEIVQCDAFHVLSQQLTVDDTYTLFLSSKSLLTGSAATYWSCSMLNDTATLTEFSKKKVCRIRELNKDFSCRPPHTSFLLCRDRYPSSCTLFIGNISSCGTAMANATDLIYIFPHLFN